MPQNFIACDRDQALLMPPSLLDWVPEDHLVWTILGAVAEMDLAAIYGAYRPDGHGRPAYDPSGDGRACCFTRYSQGNRSSRGIECKCREDVVYMVITAQRVPDHSTIAEFRAGTRRRWRGCSRRCWRCAAEAGLVKVGVVAIDGTKISANASMGANRSL